MIAVPKFQAILRAVAFAACCGLAGTATSGSAVAQVSADTDIVTHKLALQVSENDKAVMRSALDIASNVSRSYSDKAEEVEIRIVVYGPGVDMLRLDRSPVLDRLKAFEQSMPNVTFAVCDNTLDTLERHEGRRPELVPYAEVVEAGVVELVTLDEQGYTIVKP
jgi:intracellular sulfur oxidation DsrE/DsrF family protein